MKGLFLLSLLGLALASCQPVVDAKRPYTVYTQDETYYTSTIVSDAQKKVTLANVAYPIYLSIHPNKTFHYNLPRLGEGDGIWSYARADGFIRLHAERTLFVMDFQIRSMDLTNTKALSLEFSDRFGPKFLPVEVFEQ